MHSGNQEGDSEKVTDIYVTASRGSELLCIAKAQKVSTNIWEGGNKAELLYRKF